MPRETSIIIEGQLIGEGIPQVLRSLLLAQTGKNGRLVADGVEHRFTRFTLNEGSRYPTADWVSVFSMAELARQQRVLAWRIVLIGVAGLLLAVLSVVDPVGFAQLRVASQEVTAPIARASRSVIGSISGIDDTVGALLLARLGAAPPVPKASSPQPHATPSAWAEGARAHDV